MITLAIFEKMAEDSVAGLSKNKDFYWEEMPTAENGKPAQGIWMVTRSASTIGTKGHNMQSIVDFYVTFKNKVKTESTQKAIFDYFLQNQCFCLLSGSVGGTTYKYENIRVFPASTPQNSGMTENGLIVKVASFQLVYDE